MFQDFIKRGKASFVVGGQWGSEGKGAAAAFLTRSLIEIDGVRLPSTITTNAGAQAGHTSTHAGRTRVAFHLPTASLIASDYGCYPVTYINAGAIIDPKVCLREINESGLRKPHVFIHPHAAVITPDCQEAEGRADSAQTKIASTRKGVGEALARKVLRSGMVAKNHPGLRSFVSNGIDLNRLHLLGEASLVEVPQGISLSLNGDFYPHVTSRNCTVMQAMSDADIHPQFYGNTLLVLRTYPIRVGNITVDDGTGLDPKETVHSSGSCYPDQKEITWTHLGVEPEITTVTKRVRRVFTFSRMQCLQAMALTRPSHVQLTFCDYPGANVPGIRDYILQCADNLNMERPVIIYQYGPTTDDCYPDLR